VQQYTHSIKIRRGLSVVDSVLVFLFELCNAANAPEFLQYRLKNYKGTAEGYARAIELVEFTSVTRYCGIVKILLGSELILGLLSAEDLEFIRKDTALITYENFDQYWAAQNVVYGSRTLSHADTYREQFRSYHARKNSFFR
jgi:hypothetical protein